MEHYTIKQLIVGFLLTLSIFMMLGEAGFYAVAVWLEDREAVNRVRKLYRITLYILLGLTLGVIVI